MKTDELEKLESKLKKAREIVENQKTCNRLAEEILSGKDLSLRIEPTNQVLRVFNGLENFVVGIKAGTKIFQAIGQALQEIAREAEAELDALK